MTEYLLASNVLGDQETTLLALIQSEGAPAIQERRPILYSLISAATLKAATDAITSALDACCVIDLPMLKDPDLQFGTFENTVLNHEARAPDTIFTTSTRIGIQNISVPTWVTANMPALRRAAPNSHDSHVCFNIADTIVQSIEHYGRITKPLTPFATVFILEFPFSRSVNANAHTIGPALKDDRWSLPLEIRRSDAQCVADDVQILR